MAEAAREFAVDWEDPADAEQCWEYDPVHSPDPVTPLSFDLSGRPFVEGFGWGGRPLQANYYLFYAVRQPPEPEPQAPERLRADLDRLRQAGERWRDEILPEVLGYTEHYRTTDFDALSDGELAAEIERLPRVRFRSGRLHTMVVTPHYLAMTELIATYRELTGGDELGALRLVQGYGNKSLEAGERLWQVARVAGGIPSVRERLVAAARPALQRLAEFDADAAAAPFLEAFRSYLDEFGWRAGGDFADRTWAEDPSVPLAMLRAYFEVEGYDPFRERERLAAERDAEVSETLAELNPNARRRLGEVLSAVREVVTLSEDHNYYIDQRLSTMPRRLVLAAGRRLVSKGALDDPADVFYLRGAELCNALDGRTDGMRETAGRRREELGYWRTVTPPRYIGAPPPAGAAAPAPRERRPRGGLRGTGASAGVARGPARVLRHLGEAGSLRPGDVLVTRATLPPWTPLFGIACAVVTETGGMLSHTAIVAREYGIPAVLGVPDAMGHLRDGRLIEVDGTAGAVRLVG